MGKQGGWGRKNKIKRKKTYYNMLNNLISKFVSCNITIFLSKEWRHSLLLCIEINKASLSKLRVGYHLSICLPGRVSWFLVIKIWSSKVMVWNQLIKTIKHRKHRNVIRSFCVCIGRKNKSTINVFVCDSVVRLWSVCVCVCVCVCKGRGVRAGVCNVYSVPLAGARHPPSPASSSETLSRAL